MKWADLSVKQLTLISNIDSSLKINLFATKIAVYITLQHIKRIYCEIVWRIQKPES